MQIPDTHVCDEKCAKNEQILPLNDKIGLITDSTSQNKTALQISFSKV